MFKEIKSNRYSFYQLDGHAELVAAPVDEKIVGVVCVIHIAETGEIFLSQELMDKPHFDKRKGDFSPPAGGRESGEGVREALVREVEQETGLLPGEYVVDPVPLGWFQFPVSDKYPEEGPWIVAHSAIVSEQKLNKRMLGPTDGETNCPLWFNAGSLLDRLPFRGGMEGILRAALVGLRLLVEPVSAGRHHGEEILDPTALVIDRSGNQRLYTWKEVEYGRSRNST